MSNEGTKKQIKDWLDEAVYKAKNPDPREAMKKKRMEKVKKIQKKYGF